MSRYQYNVPLKAHNTFGINARAASFIEIQSEAELKKIIQENDTPKYILGGGSNILLTKDYEHLMIKISIPGIQVIEESADQILLEIGAGENWHNLVMHCLEQDWGGLENLSLIPGQVGAAPIQNIGAYGVELKNTFVALEAIDLHTSKTTRFTAAECQFGYRDSIFKQSLKGQKAITRVILQLSKKNHQLHTGYGAISTELEKMGIHTPTIQDISRAVIAIRQSKLPNPADIGNGGSFFKNPELPLDQFQNLKKHFPELPGYPVAETVIKVPAAWLIDQAGWKGKRFGNYGVHERQALVLVNHGGASGKDIYNLSTRIMKDIQEKYGIELEREINIL